MDRSPDNGLESVGEELHEMVGPFGHVCQGVDRGRAQHRCFEGGAAFLRRISILDSSGRAGGQGCGLVDAVLIAASARGLVFQFV